MAEDRTDVAGTIDTVLVDDAVDVRRVVALQLGMSRRFVIVGEGGTGREAIELAAVHRPALLLLDVSMPDMDGLDALPDILKSSPETRVVMFSGFSGPGLVDRARVLGAVDYIEKSTPIRELPGRLLQALGQAPSEVVSTTATPTPAPGSPRHPDIDVASPERAARTVLADHLERFRDVFDRATTGMATLTLTGTIVRSNDTFASFFGAGGELLGKRYLELVHTEAADEVEQATASVIAGADSSRAVDHRRADGERWLRSTIAAVRDQGGLPLYLFLQVEDITARRAAREELRRSEERFSLLVSSVVDYAIFMLDPDGYVVTWNAGAERIKGWSADEILGQHFRIFSTEEAREAGRPEYELETAVRDGRFEDEGWRVRKDGSRFWALVVITPLFDSSGGLVGFAKVTRDFTQRQAAVDAMADAKEKYAAAAAEKGRFLAIAAHELRSPATSVNAAASMLRDRWADLDEPARTELLAALISGSARIRRLIEDMLLASQLEERGLRYATETIDVRSAIDLAVHAIPDLLEVEVHVPPGASVQADPARLGQVLTNLLLNAKEYGRPPISVEAAVNADGIVLKVVDGGPGVTDDVVRFLFTPFMSGLGRPNRGTGLGLFIVRELALGMGGDAWYERENGGTVFAVRLPSSPT